MITTAMNEHYSVRRYVSMYSKSKRTWRHDKRAAKSKPVKV